MNKPGLEFYNRQGAWETPAALEWLTLLHRGDKESIEARKIELAQCKESPWHFLIHWVQTEDAQNEEFPFQPFPNELHLQVLTEFWVRDQFMLVPKSRQMTCTWLFCGLYLWQSMFFPSRLTIFQCKIEQDSDANLQRAFVMWERLPAWMKEWQPAHYTFCNLKFPRSRSEMRAVAAGSKHYRQRTLTGVFCDEAAYDSEFDQVFGAAKSALGRVGKFTAVSSATPSAFGRFVHDEE